MGIGYVRPYQFLDHLTVIKKVSTYPNTANQFSLRVLGTYKVKVNIENKKKQISKRGKKAFVGQENLSTISL